MPHNGVARLQGRTELWGALSAMRCGQMGGGGWGGGGDGGRIPMIGINRVGICGLQVLHAHNISRTTTGSSPFLMSALFMQCQ